MYNKNDCDKTTIKVQVSDAYRIIIIDWSKNIKKEIFRQLAEFTGISIEKTQSISFSKPPVGNDVNPPNPFLRPTGDLAICHFEKSFSRPAAIPQGYYLYTKEDYRDKFFRDGDCFALNTRMFMTFTLDKFNVQYNLVHRDLIDETDCNQLFCHHISKKAFLDKQAKISNSDIESYLRNQPRPVPIVEDTLDEEFHAARVIRQREIHADLNIGQYFHSYCRFFSDGMFPVPSPRIYWPNRG
ncbi:uncharacterized protein LOC107369697 [Tetranychus urticae]|uniref:Uncharacterized protein n=1 Tax=Tetranychus urticae TaxID=32264 RepID=T1L5R3_TETUR|nr:uncharacterized protein LOC107365197 [Tetranychus urticae]XP_015793190.1 uncharacterized protein LOC107369697 [Tetranychus urticae]